MSFVDQSIAAGRHNLPTLINCAKASLINEASVANALITLCNKTMDLHSWPAVPSSSSKLIRILLYNHVTLS